MNDVVLFHLAKYFPPRMRPSDMAYPETLYEQIKTGVKRSEWREATPYWLKRLCFSINILEAADKPVNISKFLKVNRAWFVQGYPKRNLPRLEARIYQLFFHSSTQQLEITFGSVQEKTRLIIL